MEAISRFRWSPDDIRKLIDRQTAEKGRKSADVVIELPKPKHVEKFIRGPIPLDWLKTAIPCSRKSVNVALALWYSAGFNRSAVVKLSRATLAHFDVTTETARSVLIRFEQAGLVTVDRKRGRSPIVTIRGAAVPS